MFIDIPLSVVLSRSGASAALPKSTGFSHLRDAACLNEFILLCSGFNADGKSMPHFVSMIWYGIVPKTTGYFLDLGLFGGAQFKGRRHVKRGDYYKT